MPDLASLSPSPPQDCSPWGRISGESVSLSSGWGLEGGHAGALGAREASVVAPAQAEERTDQRQRGSLWVLGPGGACAEPGAAGWEGQCALNGKSGRRGRNGAALGVPATSQPAEPRFGSSH